MKKNVEREDEVAKDPALTGWIGKETSLAVKAGPVVMDPDEVPFEEDPLPAVDPPPNDPVSVSVSSGSSSNPEEDEGETRELS